MVIETVGDAALVAPVRSVTLPNVEDVNVTALPVAAPVDQPLRAREPEAT